MRPKKYIEISSCVYRLVKERKGEEGNLKNKKALRTTNRMRFLQVK